MSDYRIFLRNNIRKYRLACGYTQQNVAAVLGLSRSAYTYYETGTTTPDIESITRLARMFGVTLDQLVSPEEQPDLDPGRLRVKHRPKPDPLRIGDLTEEEKVLIARLRSGDKPGE